jgi:hypothetical protein
MREKTMTDSQFDYVSTLQYRLKSYAYRIKEFESGEIYVSMKADIKRIIESYEREVRGLKAKLADANAHEVTMGRKWMQVIADMEKEHKKELAGIVRTLKDTEERALRAERTRDALMDQVRDIKKELYEVKVELDDTHERNKKLLSQLHKDYENSSVPSSAKPNRKKIPNSREKTEKKPGGQPGHEYHGRKTHEPTNRIMIEPPREYTENPDYRPTGRIITKQVIRLRVILEIDEYSTPEFRHTKTRQRVHAEFPEGVDNEVNYGGSVKAFAFLLNNYCNVSIDKVRDFMRDMTGGRLEMSHGMICGLSRDFSRKTKGEQKEAIARLLSAPFMCTDFTGVRVNGEGVQVNVCANTGAVKFSAREHKGFAGVDGTPVIDYQGTLVHDHDKTFYNYGGNHQECLGHPIRYLKGSIENEPELTWHKQMRELLQEVIHYRNSVGDDAEPVAEDVESFRNKYLDILDIARMEYEYEPPTKYNKDGFNLYKKLEEYIDNHLLFLSDHRLPATNNLSERLLRLIKRKFKQVMTFRSFDCLGYYCDALGVIESLRMAEQNLYSRVSDIFEQQ